MRRLFAFAFLPVVLLALEPVNLIKDHSFEKDSEVWQTYAGGQSDLDSAVANRHDMEKAWSGSFSGSSDNRTPPGEIWANYYDSAKIIQSFSCPKTVSDIDSLTLHYSILPVKDDFNLTMVAYIGLYLDPEATTRWVPVYFIKAANLNNPTMPVPYLLVKVLNFPADTSWHFFAKGIRSDLERLGVPSNAGVDSLFIVGWGKYSPPWRGQKVYWDDIRLMGYADYDVGVKEILSGDSLREGHPYTPEARIKNFGREPADSFLVIAEIWDTSGLAYADTLPWSLEGDTEDIASFADFTPDHNAPYILTIRTVMEPDECDEDDEVSRTLFYSAIAEKPVVNDFNLEVKGFCSDGVLRVSYSLPYGESGTITLYDAAGRRIERMNVRGSGSVDFSPALPSGVYFVRLESADLTITRKAVLLR